MHHLQFLAFYDSRGRPAPCSYHKLLLSIKKPFTPWVSGFMLCPKGSCNLKKHVLLEENAKRKGNWTCQKGTWHSYNLWPCQLSNFIWMLTKLNNIQQQLHMSWEIAYNHFHVDTKMYKLLITSICVLLFRISQTL